MVDTIFQTIARNLVMFVILAISSAGELAAQSPSVASIKALHGYAEKTEYRLRTIYSSCLKSLILSCWESVIIVTRYSIILFSTY